MLGVTAKRFRGAIAHSSRFVRAARVASSTLMSHERYRSAQWTLRKDFFSNNPESMKTLEDLIITKTCAERIRTLNVKSAESPRRLRLAVEGGGCSGFQYLFTMEDSSNPLNDDDLKFERDDAIVVIDEMSMDFVRGSTIDYTQEMIRSSFVVLHNPNSEAGCGCGASFALKMD